MSPQGLPRETNPSKAHPARVYDYFLGGKDNYESDREVARQLLAGNPTLGHAPRANRRFMNRATCWIARQGIRQFIDIGTGIPTEPNLHQIAQAEAPEARIVYVDNDPIVLAHADALLRSTPEGRTAYIHGDVREPRDILESPELHETIDFSRPVALSLYALLHFVTDDQDPMGILDQFVTPLAPGSFVALSNLTLDFDQGTWAQSKETYEKGVMSVATRSREEFAKLFGDLELVEPGIVPPHRWHPDDTAEETMTDAMASMWAGVARKP